LAKKRKGIVFIISAPSGSGKTTLLHELSKSPLKLTPSKSVTTRKPRSGERNGHDYFFISMKEFLRRKNRKEFLEWANVFGEYYATPKKFVRETANQGKDIVLAIDVQGARQVLKALPDAVSIFILPPSVSVLKKRLLNRNTDTRKEIKKRLNIARHEISHAGDYDYIIVNNKLHSAVRRLEAIIVAERHKNKRR
jgi:guanylate kinase